MTLTLEDEPGTPSGITKIRSFIPFTYGINKSGGPYISLEVTSASYVLPNVGVFSAWPPQISTDEALQQEYDPTKYSNISAVYFEAVLCAASGKIVYIELYDVTNASAISGSELSHNSTTTTRKRSGDIKANFSSISSFISLRMKGNDASQNECFRAQMIIDQSA